MSTQDTTKRNLIADIIRAGRGKKNRRQNERWKFFENKRRLSAIEEAEEKEKLALQKEKKRLLLKQAHYYADLLPRALKTQEQFATELQYRKDAPAKRTIKMVKIIPPILIHNDYFMIQIDMRNLPTGVSADKLKHPSVLESLGFALQTEVGVDCQSKERGFWYLVACRGGVGIIPRQIDYQDVITMMPKRASSWAIPIGVGENKKLTWLDIAQKPHFLIAGSTGSGKSVFLKNMLLTLCQNNSPKRLRVVLCDFKAGADMVPLAKLPHLGTPTKIRTKKGEITGVDDAGNIQENTVDDFGQYIITEPKDVLPVLAWADREITWRNKLFATLDEITSINEYNARFRLNPMPRILLVLDEFPVAMLEVSKTDMANMKQLVSIITRKGRSAGISVIIGSQVGSAEVLSGAISQNIGTRIVGYSTGPQSQVLLGNWFAHNIENRKGRVAYRDDITERELQAPWVSPQLAKALVDEIVTQWSDNHDADALALNLFDFCMEKADGLYDPETLYKYFPDDEEVTNAVCREIGRQYELRTQDDGTMGPIIHMREVDFYLVPGIPGVRPRKLVTVEEYRQSIMQPLEEEPAQAEAEPEQALPEPEYAWTEAQIIRWAVLDNNGELGQRAIYAKFKSTGMPKKRAELFGPDRVGREFIVDGANYVVVPAVGRLPVRLVTCDLLPERELPNDESDTDTLLAEGAESQNELVDLVSELTLDDTPDWLQPL